MPAWSWTISRQQTGHRSLADDGDAAQDIDSLGGLVVSLLGRVPQRGEIVAHPDGIEFEVLEADPRRVTQAARHACPKPAPRNERRLRDWATDCAA